MYSYNYNKSISFYMMIKFEKKKKKLVCETTYQKLNTPVAKMHDIYSSYEDR